VNALEFPAGFLWGAATSAHQVEGNNLHSDWWAWEQAGRVKEPSGLACDQYRRFASDFDLAASLGHNAHRLSIEWSRLEPKEGEWNDEALAHYIEVVQALRQRRLEPIVTLHHFTSPRWLTQQGGWVSSRVVDRFARYVERVAKALGPLVRYWITINEPMVFVKMHYVAGEGPPGRVSQREVLRVIEHLIRAHAVSFHVLHEAAPADGPPFQVSIAKNLPVFVPCRGWWVLDRLGAGWIDTFFNRAFLEAVTQGRWSVPGVGTWKIPDARATLDFLGVNFYGRQFIRWNPLAARLPSDGCDLGHHRRDAPERTLMGWDIDAGAFTRTLLRAARLDLPILVTESGAWLPDEARWRYIARYLAALHQAMERGARVIGYLYWSLIDNFEWAHGYGPRFGLIEVEYETQQRRMRDSARRYAEVCRTNRLSIADI
jgi:beta-glucosidase